MRRRLVLFTSNHPFTYTGGETMFVAPELPHLATAFSAGVTVVPLHDVGDCLPLPPGVSLDRGLAGAWRRRRAWYHLLAPLWPGFCGELLRALRCGGVVGAARVWRWAAVAQATWHWLGTAHRGEQTALLYTYWRGGATLASARWSHARGDGLAVTRVHRHELYDEAFSTPFQPWTEVYQQLARVITIARHGLDYLLARGVANDRLMLARLGVAAAQRCAAASTDGTLRLVSCSSITPVKRVPFVAEVMVALARAHPGQTVQWVHFGDGPQRPAVESAVRGAPPNLHVRLAGQVENVDVRAHYAESAVDLFVLLSASEGLPVSIQEALAAGIPVLATDVGGVAEAVTPAGDNGELVSPHADVAGVLSAIERLLIESGPARRAQRRLAAWQRWANDFDASRNHSALAHALNDLTR